MRKISKKSAEKLLEKADKLRKQEQRRTRIVQGPGAGDKLASGGDTATYNMPCVTQLKWDLIFMDAAEFEKTYKKTKKQALEEHEEN